MATKAADLQQLKGVGRVLSKRFHEMGLDSFEKIAESDEAELKKVGGINPRMVTSILQQAKALSEAQPTASEERAEAVKIHLADLKGKLQALVEVTRQRFPDDLSGKHGKKISSDLVRILNGLEKIGECGKKRCKRAGRALAKAEKRVEGLQEASLRKVHKGLKKARKAVLKVL